jgi:adenosine deaminase
VNIEDFIRRMPKAELHVHLEGAIQPETLLKLARRNQVALPADSAAALRAWYRFVDFPHFITVYKKISECIRTAEDIELIAREFLAGQAAQHIIYSEVTYTAYTHYQQYGIPFEQQLAALDRARAWAADELGVDARWIIDISREVPAEEGLVTAEWAIGAMGDGVVALGLGGDEVRYPPEKFAAAFAMAEAAKLPAVPHAGEVAGPQSIWGALDALKAVRIGHGVRCLEDPALVAVLRERQIPLDVCPTSNVCLGVAPDIASHPLPRLLAEGLYVTVNSDDPPLFNTTLADEYLKLAAAFGFGQRDIEGLVLNAVRASLLDARAKAALAETFEAEFERLRAA